jgi:hypothetical protein
MTMRVSDTFGNCQAEGIDIIERANYLVYHTFGSHRLSGCTFCFLYLGSLFRRPG